MSFASENVGLTMDVSTSEDLFEVPTSTTPYRRIGFVSLGLTCLVACGIVGTMAIKQPQIKDGMTVRELLHSDAMTTTMAKNQIKILKLAENEDKAKVAVAKSLKKFEQKLQIEKPAQSRMLDDLRVSPRGAEYLTKVVSSMTDPRTQELGYKVSKALLEGRKGGYETTKAYLNEVFNKEDGPKLRQLRSEFFKGLRPAAPENTKVTFSVESMRLLRSVPKTSRRLTDSSMSIPPEFEEALGFFGSLEEQARLVLAQTNQLSGFFDNDKVDESISPEAESGVGALSFFTNLADCVIRANGNDVKEGMCPAKYSTAAADALSCIDNWLGVQGDNGGITNNDASTGGVFASGSGQSSQSVMDLFSNFVNNVFGSSTTGTGTTGAATTGTAGSSFGWQ